MLSNYPRLGEKLFFSTLPNGLRLCVLPRPGFTKKLAYFVTDFGSIHTSFLLDGQAVRAPMGVAHFLEHKLFDMPEGDVSQPLAQLGAAVNAFTTYDMTAYYFSCTDHFEKCLELLVRFVITPYFTDESVAKEQGIIGQEIDMDQDVAESRVFENLMEAMYQNHRIREPVLGDRASIARITPQVLHQSHRAFYRPENMMLCVLADADPEVILSQVQQLTQGWENPQVSLIPTPSERSLPPSHMVESYMDVSAPLFQLGFKCRDIGEGEEAARQEFIAELASEVLFGESSDLYLKLYEQGLIDGSFAGGFETVRGAALLTASGESPDPKAVRDAILERAGELANTGIDPETFQRLRRSAMGRRLRSLDSFDATCFRLCAYRLTGFDYFRFPEIYETLTPEDIRQFIRQAVTEENACLSVIYPKEEKTIC